jgi:hypothetical protein
MLILNTIAKLIIYILHWLPIEAQQVILLETQRIGALQLQWSGTINHL